MENARDVTFMRGTRIFEEGGAADRFWITRSGAVALDLHVPGLRAPIFETVGPGELLGWSWMFEPYRWRFGAQAIGRVEAYEFDAATVKAQCRQDPYLGFALLQEVAAIVAQRLTTARGRLLELYGPQPPVTAAAPSAPARAEEYEEPAIEQGPSSVGDVMTHGVVAVDSSASFKGIVQTLNRWRVSALPVIDENGRVVGVISEADLLHKEEFHDRSPSLLNQFRGPDDLAKAGAITAEQLMTTPAVTVHVNASIAEAARVMARNRIKRLPVVDSEGRLDGIVSRGDLLRVFLRTDEDIAEDVRRETDSLPFLARTPVDVEVADGVVTLHGEIADTAHIPLLVRLVRAVEGVVDVVPRLTGRQS